MPEVLRSATLTIDLPIGSPLVVIGRDTEGKPVCQVTINAIGIHVARPRGGESRTLNWEQLIGLVG